MKKKYSVIIASVLASIMMLTGCSTSAATKSGQSATEGNTATEETAKTEAVTTASGPSNDYLITNVYGDGQKPWLLVLEYDHEIDPASVSVDDFTVTDHEISAVYTNTEASIPTENVAGNYVLIELSTDYTNSGYTTDSGDGSSGDMDAALSGDADSQSGGGGIDSTDDKSEGPSARMMALSSEPSNQLIVTWTQSGEIKAVDGTTYVASSESSTTDYNENDNLLVKNFEQFTFETKDGTSMMYNLYLPTDYSEDTSYPIVLFMPDATGEGSDPYLTLTESLGGVIWTTDESQAQNPCIVLAPQYESSNTTDASYTMELLQSVLDEYNVDSNRIYLVGQSSGTIRSIKLMIDYPNTFAGAMLVAGQADSAYVDLESELADENIWMICSAGDKRAYPGMTSIMEAVEGAGTSVTTSGWSADLSDEEQKTLTDEMEKAGTSIYFTVYDAGTVMEDDVPVNAVTEHMNTWRVAYNLSGVRNWLFKQTNN